MCRSLLSPRDPTHSFLESIGFCHGHRAYGVSCNLEEWIMVQQNEPWALSPETWLLFLFISSL